MRRALQALPAALGFAFGGVLFSGGVLFGVVVLVCVVGSTAGCATAEAAAREDDRRELAVSISRHHLDLRWGRLPEAARFVHPDLQPAFLEDWSRRAEIISLTEVETLNLVETADGTAAEATVRIAWTDNRSMTVGETITRERWALDEETGSWRVIEVAELPPL